MMYNNIVTNCFFSPKHVGVIDLNNQFAVVFKSSQKGQGQLELYLQCNPNGEIERTCFKTDGNPYIIASLEWVCRQLEGSTIDSAPKIDYQMIVKELGIPVAQYSIALRVANAYKEVLFLMKMKQN